MIRKYYDKILLGIALALLLSIFLLAAFQPAPKSITEYVDITSLRPNNTYEVSAMPEPDLTIPEWDAPGPQSAGVEWTFDLFTPPVIYFSPRNQTFTVLPVTAPPPPPWPIELVTIREELYRIQLRGWIGEEGSYRINLENRETGQLLLAREGTEYPDQDFTVRSFRVVSGGRAAGRIGRDTVGRAVIYDHRLDREVTLHSETRIPSDESTAIFRSTDTAGSPDSADTAETADGEYRVGEGESFTYGGFTYTVEEITPPVRARVTRSGRGTEPETKTFVAQEATGTDRTESSDSPNTSDDPDF
ncbi:MAG TPA: hypothetical protein VK041_03165 [Opitutales bacterium]|nr:hypothetical protein [Opitutales bacterium]